MKIDDGSDKPLGYTSPDGHLEVRELADGTRGYAETELGQHDRWMRQCPDLYRLYVDLQKPGFPWYLQAQLGSGKGFTSDRRLSIWQRVRILLGAPVTVVFRSPDGKCHAACSIHFGACRDWFDDEGREGRAVAVTDDDIDPYGEQLRSWPDPRIGPPRWACKRCGKERRRTRCLHCGNAAPLTDERRVPGVIS